MPRRVPARQRASSRSVPCRSATTGTTSCGTVRARLPRRSCRSPCAHLIDGYASMQVVYTPAHLGHDITVETYMGVPVPANEVAERAERIRMALEADGGFAFAAT